MIEHHIEPVGSLLRPEYLLEAREDRKDGTIRDSEFKSIEDGAVREAVRLQEDLNLPILTDGEMRRESFQSKVTENVMGFGDVSREAFLWGDWYSEEYDDLSVERPESIKLTQKLQRPSSIFLEEFESVQSLTDRIVKLTVPSPGLFLNFWSEEQSVYGSQEGFMSDLIGIYRDEINELLDAGLRYIQIDAPHYPLLLNENYRSFYCRRNEGLAGILQRWTGWDNRVTEGWDNLTVGMHLCRGNQGSRWLVEGEYEPLAEGVFNCLNVDRFLLEYDDERSGGFEPLRRMPDETMAMLGLISTKHSELEDPGELRCQVHRAADHHPLSKLGICPQCGFSSSTLGNKISQSDQKRKLELLVQINELINWG